MRSTFIYNSKNQKYKRRYLRSNSTEAEVKLWSKIKRKQLGVIFRRQYSIGPYFIDFYCPSKRLAIEVDGAQHKAQEEYDKYRTKYFEFLDITVIRFWNSQITNSIEDVLREIKRSL